MPLYRNPANVTIPVSGSSNIVWLPDIIDLFGGGPTKLDGVPTYNAGSAEFLIADNTVVAFMRSGVLNFWEYVDTFGDGFDNDILGRVKPDDADISGKVWQRLGASMSGLTGQQPVSLVSTSQMVAFASPLPAGYQIVSVAIENLVDVDPDIITADIFIDLTASGFTVVTSQPAPNSNYTLKWSIAYSQP